MWQMWCRLISHDCWQAAGNSLLRSKSSGEPLSGEGGRPKIIAPYLITLHLPPLTSTQRNKIKRRILSGILQRWLQCIPSQQYITNVDCYSLSQPPGSALWLVGGGPDRAGCQHRISAARAAAVLFCMSSCRRTSAALPGFRVHVPAEPPDTETHSERHFGGKKQAPPPPS